jgi:hypothetical protein
MMTTFFLPAVAQPGRTLSGSMRDFNRHAGDRGSYGVVAPIFRRLW